MVAAAEAGETPLTFEIYRTKLSGSMMSRLKSATLTVSRRLRCIRQASRNRSTVHTGTQSGQVFFGQELKQLLGCADKWLADTAIEYRDCSMAWRHLSGLRSPSRKTDGFAKSFDVSEGFALWALVKHVRPKVVVELGVLHGVSSRLWKEALKAYVPDHELILCDLEDKRELIDDSECTFLKGDARRVLPRLFASEDVGVLHNDAHPYGLVHWSVTEALSYAVPLLTFHDVGRGARGPFRVGSSQLDREQRLANSENWAQCGHWERHVMAEVFGEHILYADEAESDAYRIRVFDSLFGLGVALQKEN